MKVLFDTSVLLDLLLNRPPWSAEMAVVVAAHRSGTVNGLLAAFAVPTIFYITRRQTDLATAHAAVQECLATLPIVAVDHTALLTAQGMPGPDFEDNLQIACAMQAGADGIVTRDRTGFVQSPVPVFTPAEMVAKLTSPPAP